MIDALLLALTILAFFMVLLAVLVVVVAFRLIYRSWRDGDFD